MTDEEQLDKIRTALRQIGGWASIARVAEVAHVSRNTASKFLGRLLDRHEAELDVSELPYKKYRLKRSSAPSR